MIEDTTQTIIKTTPYHGDKVLPEEDIIIIIVASISSICLLAVILAFIWKKINERREDKDEFDKKPTVIVTPPSPETNQSSQIPKDVEILIDEPIKNSQYDLNKSIYFTNSCKYF